jgi:hypothetical protein
MDAYKVQQTVKNGQLIIDLPAEFDDSLVEVVVSLAISDDSAQKSKSYPEIEDNFSIAAETATLPYISSKSTSFVSKEDDESDFIEPSQKIELPQFKGALDLDLTDNELDAFARSLRGDSPFVPPRKKIKLSTLMGAYKNKMTNDEIDSLTKSWRDEWERDFS